MVYIVKIHLEGGSGHEHITKVQWQDSSNNTSNVCSREDMVGWLNKGNKAYVTDGVSTVEVLVVDAKPPYLRTYADGKWTNNLLALPKF